MTSNGVDSATKRRRHEWCVSRDQYSTALNIAGAALFALHASAATTERRTLIKKAIKRAGDYARDVEGWSQEQVNQLIAQLVRSF